MGDVGSEREREYKGTTTFKTGAVTGMMLLQPRNTPSWGEEEEEDTTAGTGPDKEVVRGLLQLGAERNREIRISAGHVAEDIGMLRNIAALSASKKIGDFSPVVRRG